MSQNKRMGKSVADASWAELVRQLKYKADWQGKAFYQIGRYEPSSKKCHICSYKHDDLELKDRQWSCPNCKTVHDRDINAALNIKAEGLKHLLAAGQTERLNACGETVRLSRRARLGEARSTRPSGG